MAKQIPTSSLETVTSRKEAAMIKRPATHTLNKQATLTLHSLLRNNKPTEGDSNRGATRTDTVKLRQPVVAALRIQAVQVRQAAATVRQMPRSLFGTRINGNQLEEMMSR